MFSDQDLKVLLAYSTDSQVLSVYLNTDPTEEQTEAAKIELRNLFKQVDLPEDIQAIEHYVNFEYDWAAKGLAIFSDQRNGFFHAFQFDLPLPNSIFTDEKPVVRPLVHLMDQFTGWGIVLVDKQSARLFSLEMGALVEAESILGDEVKQQKRGGGDMMHGRKGGSNLSSKVENIIERNIKEVIESAAVFFNKHHIRRILIGGSDDNIARFKEALPKSWQSLVVGEFSLGMTASHPEILAQSHTEIMAIQHKINQSLVNQAITQTAKGENGVIGLIDTLNAIHEGRVKTLLVLHDFEKAGYRCQGCAYLTVQALDTCPFCNASFATIDKAVEMAVQQTLIKNSEAKILLENEALAQAGSIAALLRY